jgi:hypothetical protein
VPASHNCSSPLTTTTQSQSHIETDGQSVSLGVEPHLGLMTRYLLLLNSYGLAFCGAPCLTRGRVCLLYMLLALARQLQLKYSPRYIAPIRTSRKTPLPLLRVLSLTGKQRPQSCSLATAVVLPPVYFAVGLHATLISVVNFIRPPLWSSGLSSWLQDPEVRVRFPGLPDFF